MELEETRNLFPHIEKGITYLNHAATGPFSTKLLSVMQEFFRQRSEDNIDDYPAFVKIVEETKLLLASFLNTNVERIAFADNTTNGLNVLAQGLNWKKDDQVILNDIEFPANVYPFLNLEKKGVKIKFVKSHNGIVSAEDLIKEINDKTRLISVSMVQFLTGYKIDLEKLGKACKEAGIILSVDAIQGFGAFTLDIKKINIDFISCGTQKWLLALQGLSFIFVSEHLQKILEPSYVGWLGVNDAWNMLDYNLSLKDSAERFQPGTLNSAGIYALNASLNLFRDFGVDEVEKRVISNSKILINELEKLKLAPVLSGVDDKYLSGIISFKHSHSYSILEVLKNKKVEIAVREGFVRISPHFYNNENDIDRLIETLKSII
jgi:selenocysteine lyase/cysteine desulfurase